MNKGQLVEVVARALGSKSAAEKAINSTLKAITDARGGLDERIFVRGDKKVDYGTVMKVMGRLSQAGFRRVALVTEVDQG